MYLITVKRVGQEPGRNMALESLAVLCPTCLQPGMNMAPDWHKHPKEQR